MKSLLFSILLLLSKFRQSLSLSLSLKNLDIRRAEFCFPINLALLFLLCFCAEKNASNLIVNGESLGKNKKFEYCIYFQFLSFRNYTKNKIIITERQNSVKRSQKVKFWLIYWIFNYFLKS
jgi:hypothetical protein